MSAALGARCQLRECTTAIARTRFLCRPHWYSVPPALRARVNATWAARVKTPGDFEVIKAHEAAKAAALAAITEAR